MRPAAVKRDAFVCWDSSPIVSYLRIIPCMRKSLAFLSLFWLILSGCRKDSPVEPPDIDSQPTFFVLQNVILNQQCASSGCHNSTSRSGGLDLSQNVAFENLINGSPTNSFARNDGLLRIKPGKPDSSFLFLKVDDKLKGGYGERMPLGSSKPMPSNYREFVRQWIAAGAPKDGIVADVRLLKDPIIQNDAFVPPPPPNSGIQLHLRPYIIDPAKEREIFVYQRLTTQETLYVSKVEIKMREGSHHFILYKYFGMDLAEGVVRDLHESVAQEIFRPGREYMMGAQTPHLSYELPAQVVMPIYPAQGFDLNSHYVNKATGLLTGEVYVNLHTVPKTDSLKIAKPSFDNYVGFRLDPKQKTTVTRTTTFSKAVKIFMLSSHTHKRGESFKIFLEGGPYSGTLVYENASWDHPPNVRFPNAAFPRLIEIESGWGYRIEVVYNNETDRTIRFGLTSDDEMCIVLGYYYE